MGLPIPQLAHLIRAAGRSARSGGPTPVLRGESGRYKKKEPGVTKGSYEFNGHPDFLRSLGTPSCDCWFMPLLLRS